METVRLDRIDIATTRIGLGCSGLGGRLSESESLAVLDAAAHSGVRHFDVARSYGYGGAELALGAFFRANGRSNFTVTTKAGVAPLGGVGRLRTARAVARKFAGLHPSIRAQLNAVANKGVREGRFSVAEMRASFAKSLAALAVDQVDLLLVHECSVTDLTDELRAWLEQRVALGEARAWGVATTVADAERIVGEHDVDVVQVPAPLSRPLPRVLERVGAIRIRHSVLREDLERLEGYLAGPGRRGTWESEFGVPLSTAVVASQLIKLALIEYPDDVVLIGTQRPSSAAALADVFDVNDARVALTRRLLHDARETGSGR